MFDIWCFLLKTWSLESTTRLPFPLCNYDLVRERILSDFCQARKCSSFPAFYIFSFEKSAKKWEHFFYLGLEFMLWEGGVKKIIFYLLFSFFRSFLTFQRLFELHSRLWKLTLLLIRWPQRFGENSNSDLRIIVARSVPFVSFDVITIDISIYDIFIIYWYIFAHPPNGS